MHRFNKAKDARRRARRMQLRAVDLRPSAANDMKVVPDKREKLKARVEKREAREEC